MKRSPTRITGVFRTIVFAALGLFVGLFVARQWNPLPLRSRTEIVPAPYRISKIPGGTALRLAMVHDILHERYLRHGAAWYTQRNADARKIIAEQAPAHGASPSPAYLDALDDLAIGLERIGQYDESISLLRKKLLLISPLPDPPATRPASDVQSEFLQARDIDQLDLRKILQAMNLSPLQHHQYSTCANLGTVLVHSAMSKALAGDPDARTRVREGLDFIKRAIDINPGAHFGREIWQAIAIEDLLATMDHPDLLDKYDLIGEVLAESTGRGHQRYMLYVRGMPNVTDAQISMAERLDDRLDIDRVGIDPDWAALVNPDYSAPMPFDEPTLAIIGMWTLGGGPSPHFALTLGRIMENVGQRAIAWNAYERAVELQDHFWPDPAVRAKLVAICRARQREIATTEDKNDPVGWQDKMRSRHASELAWGLAYQKAYQDFEASQIAAGVALDDPHFYTPFFTGRPSIASDPGLSDDAILTHQEASAPADFLPCLLLGLGLGLALAVVIPERILS